MTLTGAQDIRAHRRSLATRSAAILALLTSLAVTSSAQCPVERSSAGPGGVDGNARAGLESSNLHRNYLSADGRYVSFASVASNLVVGDGNGANDVFVRDRQLGTTTRVSVATGGAEANAASLDPALSADGRWLVFQSSASNLVAGDANGRTDVFARDLLLGVTTRVSLTTTGSEGHGDSLRPDISADARWVVWHSDAPDLVLNDTNNSIDVFVHDMLSGQTNRLSVSTAGIEGDAPSLNACVSASARFVAFQSFATNLVTSDTNGRTDIFVRDRAILATTRVSTATGGTQVSSFSQAPSISADGRFVTFSSLSADLVVGDTNSAFDAFVKDRLTGVTERTSVSTGGTQGNAASYASSISADGRYVAFQSLASNLVPGDTNDVLFALTDVFVRDRQIDATVRVSVGPAGIQTDIGSSFDACLARDGTGVAFYSQATNLVPGDANGFADVFYKTCGALPEPTRYCSGDGSGTACPCGNAGLVGRGCENSFGTGGAELTGAGRASVTHDAFSLVANHLPPVTPTLFFQGDAVTNFGNGSAFGDGLRCVGGVVLRLGTHTSSAGSVAFGASVAGDPLISVRGAIPGGTITLRYYQAWYRNTVPYCGPDGFNLTNGIVVTWLP